MATTKRNELLIKTTRRLLIAIGLLFLGCTLFFVFFALILKRPLPVAFAALLTGALGGFIGIQRRLRDMSNADLELLVASWEYTLLSPFVGGILAILLYTIFLSGLVSGALFPVFEYQGTDDIVGFQRIFETRSDDFADYGKLIVWCFVAGFSERFVVNILGKLEARSMGDAGTEPSESG